jgi:hypothetical protein
MKKLTVAAIIVAVVAISGCQKGHPVKLEVDPALEEGAERIAVFPFLSALHGAEDPDDIAPATMERYFKPALDARNDYTFISEGTVRYAIEGQEWEAKYAKFIEEYPRTGKIDSEFFELRRERSEGSVPCVRRRLPRGGQERNV